MKKYKIRFYGSENYKRFILPILLKYTNVELAENNIFDIGIVADYGYIFNKNELKNAKCGFFNFHPSDLPAYRGPTPLQTMILDGVKYSYVTLIKMNEKIDDGKIISKIKFELLPTDTTESLKEKTAIIASTMLDNIFLYLNNKIKAQKQVIDNVSYTKKIEKRDCEINLKESIITAERKIRAFFPNPKAYFKLSKTRLIIHKAKIIKNKLELEIVQREGKKPLKFEDYKKGEKDKILLDKISNFCYNE